MFLGCPNNEPNSNGVVPDRSLFVFINHAWFLLCPCLLFFQAKDIESSDFQDDQALSAPVPSRYHLGKKNTKRPSEKYSA